MPSMDTTSETAAALESAHTGNVGPGESAGVQKETQRLCFLNSFNVRQSSQFCGWSSSVVTILPPGDPKVVQLQMAKQRAVWAVTNDLTVLCKTLH